MSQSWWDFVKEQSKVIVDIYKEDLAEFAHEISSDTTNLLKPTHNVTQEITEKRSQTSQASQSPTVGLSRLEQRLLKLQLDESSYLDPPSDEEDFQEWRKEFDLRTKTEEVSDLLMANQKLRDLHSELIPSISYAAFWERYFYRTDMLKREDRRRATLLERAESLEKLEGWGGWEEEEAKVGPEPESDAPTLPLPTGETVEVPPPIDLSSEDEDKAIEEEIVRRTADLPPAVALVGAEGEEDGDWGSWQ